MKSGTGSDPFAEIDEDEERQESESASSEQPDSAGGDGTERLRSREDLPYVLRRDGAKDDRKMVPLFLREEFRSEEPAFRAVVAGELGVDAEDVSKLDMREAMYRAAMDDPEAVAKKLVADGYDLV